MSDRWYEALLVCPACKGPLQQSEHEWTCQRCAEKFSAHWFPAELRSFVEGTSNDRAWMRWREAMSSIDTPSKNFFTNAKEEQRSRETALETLLRNADLRGTVLDTGCGDASLRRRLPKDTRYIGIDPRGKTPVELDDHSVQLRALGEALPLRDSSVDGALCIETLSYLVDGAKALAETARILRPGGTLALLLTVVPNTVALAKAAPSRTERLLGALRVASEHGSRAGLAVAGNAGKRAQTHFYTRAQVLSMVSVRFEVVGTEETPLTASTVLSVYARKRKVVRKLNVL